MKHFATTVAVAAGLAVVALAPTVAMASPPSKACTDQPRSAWLKMDKVRADLEKAGYSVRRIKVARNCYEAYVVKDGKRQEIFLNPVTGKIVETKSW
jgi:hypothetical protein